MKVETLEEKFYFFIGAIAAWAVIFAFVNYNLEFPAKIGKKKIDDIKNRVVSIIHGLFAFLVSGYHIYRDNPQYESPPNQIQHIIMLTSAAYYVYDFIACVYYGLADMALFLHHSLCLIGGISCELLNNCTTALSNYFRVRYDPNSLSGTLPCRSIELPHAPQSYPQNFENEIH